uniref:SGNH domain-containing protein n=1 Tax=Steinernema glaseri TaxID=37863 RepID=A0A1I8AC33_9BILA
MKDFFEQHSGEHLVPFRNGSLREVPFRNFAVVGDSLFIGHWYTTGYINSSAHGNQILRSQPLYWKNFTLWTLHNILSLNTLNQACINGRTTKHDLS